MTLLQTVTVLPSPPAAAVRPPRLLYVEDNRINALLFEETLRQHTDYELRVSEDGAQALELVHEWLPDVLVLDAHLPGMTGHEVLARLREVPALAHTPAFMCSASGLPEDLNRARAAGFRGYWTKPLDIAQVLADLRALAPAADAR
jgi:CheY-like chemotaxis protein